MKRKTNKILDEYDVNYSKYDSFTKKLELLVKEILESNSLMFHSVSGRTKERKSLANKVETKSTAHYKSLEDITDLSGIRIITYFSDDVDRVADAISKEFNVDHKASIDKRAQHDSNAFGYMSLHFIVSLTDNRCIFSEYKRFEGLYAEIQIRSVLQHAWAEIEHDLGYKSEGAIPRHLRRRFSRLASLLELGDDEFVTIRDQLSEYQNTVTEGLLKSPHEIGIDKVSLSSFIQSEFYQPIEDSIVKALGRRLTPSKGHSGFISMIESYAEFVLPRLDGLQIKTIGELELEIEAVKDEIPSFMNIWLKLVKVKNSYKSDESDAEDGDQEPYDRTFPRGIGIFYLCLIKLVKAYDDEEKIKSYFRTTLHVSEESAGDSAKLIMQAKKLLNNQDSVT